jgi:hypothetical protein
VNARRKGEDVPGLHRTSRRKAAREIESAILHAEGKQGDEAVMRLPCRSLLHVRNADDWLVDSGLSSAEDFEQGKQQ